MAFETTSNYSNYLKYLNIKQNLKIFYNNINMAEVCAVDLINAIVMGKKESCYQMGCVLFQRIRTKSLLQAFNSHKNVFSYGTIGRQDHEQLSQSIFNSVKDSQWVKLEYFYSPTNVIPRFWNFFKYTKNLPISFVNKIFLTARMTGYSFVVDDLELTFQGLSLSGKCYIPFCAPIYHEALLSLYFKQKGAFTYQTFHGVFGRYLHLITNDVVMGENIVSNRILTFGNTQREDLINDFGINKDIIIVAGNPKYPYHKIRVQNTFTSCLILGGISVYDDDLRQLLIVVEHVANKLGIKVSLKPHPLSNIQDDDIWKNLKHISLIDKSRTLISIFNSKKYDFAITHNTSSYYECMIADLKPFRWGQGENINFQGLDDHFYNAEQLEQKILITKQTDPSILSQEVEQLLANVMGYGINKYNQIINDNVEKKSCKDPSDNVL